MKFETVIGIEIHIELKTNSKMFSSAPLAFGKEPNTLLNPSTVGYPGSMPTVNKRGIELALIAADALNMEIDSELHFDRKNYCYTDLPKGYQITQQFRPIGKNGFIEVNIDGKNKRVDLERIHIEEDTAKQIHEGDVTRIDYNRCGNPLVELVTKPCITSAKEAGTYVDAIRELLEFLEISDAKMEEGSLRCDLNISIMPAGSKKFGTKVEVKNMNSVLNLQKAVEYEIEVQTKALLEGKTISQETKRWDDVNNKTITMRVKDAAEDYRYIPEVNIRPIKLDKEWIKDVVAKAPLSLPKRKEKLKGFGITGQTLSGILQSVETANYFDDAQMYTINKEQLAKVIVNELKGISKICPHQLALATDLFVAQDISSRQLKDMLVELESGVTVADAMNSGRYAKVDDTAQLEAIIREAVSSDDRGIKKYSSQPEVGINTYMGAVMKATKGQASPDVAKAIIEKVIKEFL